jgi:hypothetical protein
MSRGWRPRVAYRFVDSGCVIVTRANVDSFQAEIEQATRAMVRDLRVRYLRPPGGG